MKIKANNKRSDVYLIHVPKTAGTSIWKGLQKNNISFINNGHKQYMPKENCITVTSVRNPYGRLVSAYFYLIKGGGGTVGDTNMQIHLNNKYKNFSEFIKGLPNDEICKSYTHFRPQVYWTGKDISVFDFIIKFETLRKDWMKLCDFLSISNKMYHERKGNHEKYINYYDDECLKIVNELYSDDFETFGYDKLHNNLKININEKLKLDNTFNPAIIKINNDFIIAYRRGRRTYLSKVNSEYKLLGRERRIKSKHFKHVEDCRLFYYKNEIYASCSCYNVRKDIQMVLFKLNRKGKVIHEYKLNNTIGYNLQDKEKNWQFFEHNNILKCSYSINDNLHVVFEIELSDNEYKITNVIEVPSKVETKNYRLSCPPIKKDNLFYSIYHTKLKRKTYRYGFFRYNENYEIDEISDISNILNENDNEIVYPLSLIKNNNYIISYGINDINCFIQYINEIPIK